MHPNSKDLVELESEEGDEGMDKMWVGVKTMGFNPDGIARWMKVGSDDVFDIVLACFVCNYSERVSWW